MKFVSNYIAIVVIINMVLISPVLAMSSQNYQISQDSINFAGSDDGKSENFNLQDSAGEVTSGQMDSNSYSLESGYRQTDDLMPFMSFSVDAANATTKATYTSFASTSVNTVTMASTPAFIIGDTIVVTENQGASQRAVVGKVTSINGNVVTVDFWSGDVTTTSASPSGGDDFVYLLSGNSYNMGVLSANQVNTALSSYSITSSASNGYSVKIYSDHAFWANGTPLTSVSDGAVSLGAAEYGIRTTGADISTSTSDFAPLTTPMVIASSTIRSELRRTATIYKASGSNSLQAGHYTQKVSYIATLNF